MPLRRDHDATMHLKLQVFRPDWLWTQQVIFQLGQQKKRNDLNRQVEIEIQHDSTLFRTTEQHTT